jgi:hypothetical protein
VREPGRTADPSATLGGCDFIDFSREVIDLNEFVIPTGAKRSGEPALSEAEGNLRFLSASPTESSSCLPRPAVGELVTFSIFSCFLQTTQCF